MTFTDAKQIERPFYRIDNRDFPEFVLVMSAKSNEGERFYWIDFKVYEVVGMDVPDSGGKWFYNRNGYKSSPDPVYELGEAQVCIEGHIKWDGCCEIHIVDEPFHSCGRRDMHMLTRITDAIYDTAIAEFDYDSEDTQ